MKSKATSNDTKANELAVVYAAYKGAFGKEPSVSFKKSVSESYDAGVSAIQLCENIFNSGSYKSYLERRAQVDTLAIYYLPGIPTDKKTVDALFEKTSSYWRNEGSDEKEIYYSVVSDPKYREKFDSDDKDEFFRSGEPFTRKLLQILKEQGRDPASLTAIDYGAGVGRLAVNNIPHLKHIHAVDFSGAHLEELKNNVAERAPQYHDRISTQEIRGLSDLKDMPSVDLAYSLVVLQHNTPPVMAYVLRGLLEALKPGGLAVIHVPLQIPYYSFDTRRYLASEKAGTIMEMHILPKENMREIAAEYGCKIVDSIGYGSRRAYAELVVFEKAKV